MITDEQLDALAKRETFVVPGETGAQTIARMAKELLDARRALRDIARATNSEFMIHRARTFLGMPMPGKMACGCSEGSHPAGQRNYCEAAAERMGRICKLGWPLS